MDFSDKDKPKPKMKDGHPMGPDKDAINILLDNQLQDPSVAVRLEAAKALLTLGPPAAKSPVEFFKETEKLREAIDKAVAFEGSKSTKISTRGASPDRGVYVWVALMQLMYDERKIPDNLKILAGLVAEPDGPNADQVRLFALQALGFTAQVLETLDKTDKPLKEKVVKAVSGALAYEHEPALQLTALYSLALIGKEAGVALPDVQRVAAKAPKPPAADAPKGTPPDDTLQRAARHTAEVIRGLRKMEDYGKEDPKPGDKK
jgi:HEAT repeat protein